LIVQFRFVYVHKMKAAEEREGCVPGERWDNSAAMSMAPELSCPFLTKQRDLSEKTVTGCVR
jgi:hypothetical protein